MTTVYVVLKQLTVYKYRMFILVHKADAPSDLIQLPIGIEVIHTIVYPALVASS